MESLQIEIWPEYDHPAALVILKGELPADAKLPADLFLRIPACSGGPGAVAYAADKAGPLFNLPYDRSTAAGYITLRFTVPNRLFHVEFYDPLATGQTSAPTGTSGRASCRWPRSTWSSRSLRRPPASR